jgi:pimeloyl-ACP methyl ester carboxylesterase
MIVAFLIALSVVALAGAGLAGFTWRTKRKIESALPPIGRFIEIDGEKIHYLDAGRKAGPPIVMVNGLSGNMLNFSYLLDLLTDEFRVILLDRPGCGYSTRADDRPANLRAQGDFVASFITALSLDRPLLVGHSMGGSISLALALDHPSCIGGLALIAPATHPVSSPPKPFKGLAILSPWLRKIVGWTLATPVALANRDATMFELFAPDPVAPDFATRGGGLLALRPSAFYAASVDMISSGADFPGMVARYPTLTVPVRILYGEGDRILDVETHGYSMPREVPGLLLETIQAGHMIPVTHPEKTADFIRQAASEMTPAPASKESAAL